MKETLSILTSKFQLNSREEFYSKTDDEYVKRLEEDKQLPTFLYLYDTDQTMHMVDLTPFTGPYKLPCTVVSKYILDQQLTIDAFSFHTIAVIHHEDRHVPFTYLTLWKDADQNMGYSAYDTVKEEIVENQKDDKEVTAELARSAEIFDFTNMDQVIHAAGLFDKIATEGNLEVTTFEPEELKQWSDNVNEFIKKLNKD